MVREIDFKMAHSQKDMGHFGLLVAKEGAGKPASDRSDIGSDHDHRVHVEEFDDSTRISPLVPYQDDQGRSALRCAPTGIRALLGSY